MALKFAKRKNEASTLDDKIAKVRRQRKKEEKDFGKDKQDDDERDDSGSDESSSGEEILVADKIRVKEKKRKKKKKSAEEEEEPEKMEYADQISSFDENLSFSDMNLSRPLLKALTAMKFEHPTPIQAATIPTALLGKDICACARTGSGKTAAYMLPVLERLLYRPKQAPVSRVLVLVPTRELAVQVHQVTRQLAQFTNIETCLSAGGLDLRAQEAALRLGPDIVIATPGRLIDHLQNSPNFGLHSIEVLILDEADRMLDEFFAEQMNEIIRQCSRTRQTMLFSATMTEEVKDLATVSLKDPVRVFINENTDVALNLRQEFIRIRENKEGDREALAAALVCRTFQDQVIIFIQTKKQAHRMHILLGLLGVNVGELHGNLSQAQRLEALKKFKEQEIDVLLATDLVARGLDIEGVKTIINFTMPNTIKHYIHRVGRTARAGKSGRAVSLVGEQERKLLKEIVKKATNPVKSRVIPAEVVMKYRDRIQKMEKDIVDVMRLETEERVMRMTEMQMNKAKNILEHQADINGRPERTWFQTKKERMEEQAALRLGKFSNLPSKKQPKKKEKPTAEDRVQFELTKSQEFQARDVKRGKKAKRMRVCEDDDGPDVKKQKKNKAAKKSNFEKELTNTNRGAVKKLRAGPSYQERKEHGIKKGGRSQKKFKKR